MESQLVEYKKWDEDRARYSLRALAAGGFVYALNTSDKGDEPPHWLCAHCYGNYKKSILQRADHEFYCCPACKTKTLAGGQWPQSLTG